MKKYIFPIYVKYEEWKRKYVWLTLVDNRIIKIPKTTYKSWMKTNKIYFENFECDARAKAEYFSVGGSDF